MRRRDAEQEQNSKKRVRKGKRKLEEQEEQEEQEKGNSAAANMPHSASLPLNIPLQTIQREARQPEGQQTPSSPSVFYLDPDVPTECFFGGAEQPAIVDLSDTPMDESCFTPTLEIQQVDWASPDMMDIDYTNPEMKLQYASQQAPATSYALIDPEILFGTLNDVDLQFTDPAALEQLLLNIENSAKDLPDEGQDLSLHQQPSPDITPQPTQPDIPYQRRNTEYLDPRLLTEAQAAASSSAATPSASSPTNTSPPPTSPASQPTPAVIDFYLTQMEDFFTTHSTQIKRLHYSQRQLLEQLACGAAATPEVFKEVECQLSDARVSATWALQELSLLKQRHLLTDKQMCKLLTLQRDFQVAMQQLELYHNELMATKQSVASGAGGLHALPLVAALAITRQPYLVSVKKKAPITPPFEVRVIHGSAVDTIRPLSTVKAELVFEEYHKPKAPSKASTSKRRRAGVDSGDGPGEYLGNDTAELDQRGVAVFHGMRMLKGCRVKVVKLQFSVTLVLGSRLPHAGGAAAAGQPAPAVQLTSPFSETFVVITNEKQWALAEAIMLKRRAFEGEKAVSWMQFANTLQLHYLKMTKQPVGVDTATAVRPLTPDMLEYLHHARFGARPVITEKDFDSFWEWFGAVMHQLRFQKHLLSLWARGLIYGFLSKDGAAALLQTREPGTFLIRFSESCAGQCTLAFVAEDSVVKHYCLKPDDLTNERTLPDFLRACGNLAVLLRVKNVANGAKRDAAAAAGGGFMLDLMDKHAALKEFYTGAALSPSSVADDNDSETALEHSIGSTRVPGYLTKQEFDHIMLAQ